MKARYWTFWVLSIVMWVIGMILAPVLPAFRVMREGPTDNANSTAVEPFLPDWLFWFSTNVDNSLWGDAGWRTKHCVGCWNTYWGMVKWLWRNCAAGFSWSVLAHRVKPDEQFEYQHSGDGFNVDKSKDVDGWFYVRSETGAWHFRSVKSIGRLKICWESGWLLDVYVKDPQNRLKQPRAVFIPAFPILRLRRS